MNKLFNIYGARNSKDGKRINISLISTDEKDNVTYGTITIKKDDPKLIIKEKGVYIAVKFLEEKVKETKKGKKEDKETLASEDSLPF